MKPMPDQMDPDEFVIRFPSAGESSRLLGQIRELGTLRPLPTHPELTVLHLDKAATGTAKGRWQEVRQAVGSAAVFPVFVDETRSARFPVGTVVVRFKTPPTADALDELARKYGLTVRGRNKYAPAQVAYAVPDGAYLPELIAHIQKDAEADLEAVWPETLSAYQR